MKHVVIVINNDVHRAPTGSSPPWLPPEIDRFTALPTSEGPSHSICRKSSLCPPPTVSWTPVRSCPPSECTSPGGGLLPRGGVILTQPTAYSVLRYSVTAGAGAVTASPSAASRVVAVAVHWSREPCARAYVLGLLDAPARLCTRSVGCACAPTS